MIKEIVENIEFETNKHQELMEEKDYQEFFNSKLKEWGVKSPAELDKEKRRKFFSEIQKEWE